MKTAFLLLCVAVSLVAADTILTKNGKTCRCRKINCNDDVSCETHGCNCRVEALKVIENQKDNRYPKQWVRDYRINTEKQCRYLRNQCEKYCKEAEIQACSQLAADRFICAWTELLEEIRNSKGKKEEIQRLLEDLEKLNVKCLNNGCKPLGQGNSDCNPLLLQTSSDCVKDVLNPIQKDIKDEEIKHIVDEITESILKLIKKKRQCALIPSPNARKLCLDSAIREAAVEIRVAEESLVDLVGQCAAIATVTLIKEALVACP